MNEDSFWQLIEECTPTGADPDAERLAAALEARLMNGPLADVVEFAEQLSWALYRLDRKEYGTRASGDAFLYTRAAVVASGRAEYEAVLKDPALFSPYADDFIWAEPLLYVPDTAYEGLSGHEWDRDTRYSYESYSNSEGWAD
ncbi:DUF4240 domain-containing protein [Kitasatospora sp. NBC_01287]|uniref:DUF4240 domain-containing protein n=1 Tax=Kitasatospora sp. NBC_01287 TaxID=2903573 RepID=UPI002257E43A|nr:DUF4240 domain-containing protein [Kitasatospora sp. NBC_01287]